MALEQYTLNDLPCTNCFKPRIVSITATSRKAAILQFRRMMVDYVCVPCETGKDKRPEFRLTPDEINPSDYPTRESYLDAIEKAKSAGQKYTTERGRRLALLSGQGSNLNLLRAKTLIIFEHYEDIPATLGEAYLGMAGARNWAQALKEASKHDFVNNTPVGIIGTMADWERDNSLVFDGAEPRQAKLPDDLWRAYDIGRQYRESGSDRATIQNMMKIGGTGGFKKHNPRAGNPEVSDVTVEEQESKKETLKRAFNPVRRTIYRGTI